MLWGHGHDPISHFRVKTATLRLTRLRAHNLHPSQYSLSQAVLPAIWGNNTSGAADPAAVQAIATRQLSVFFFFLI